jgi:hypothetical protein
MPPVLFWDISDLCLSKFKKILLRSLCSALGWQSCVFITCRWEKFMLRQPSNYLTITKWPTFKLRQAAGASERNALTWRRPVLSSVSHAWSGSLQHAGFLVQFVIFRLRRPFRINHCQRYRDGLGLASGFIWVRPFIISPKPSARGYNWATLFLGDINTGF